MKFAQVGGNQLYFCHCTVCYMIYVKLLTAQNAKRPNGHQYELESDVSYSFFNNLNRDVFSIWVDDRNFYQPQIFYFILFFLDSQNHKAWVQLFLAWCGIQQSYLSINTNYSATYSLFFLRAHTQ